MTAQAHAVPLRRGACPGLSAPMPTGDGLLVRLQPIGTIPLAAFAVLCAAARKHGNGVIEVTSRGNIQIRGLNVHSASQFAADIAALDIAAADGVPVLCNPLAGLDPDEITDTTAFAAELRHRLARASLAARLSPKVSIAVDGGGALDLAETPADVRLSPRLANGAITFHVAVGGDEAGATPLGVVAHRSAPEAAMRLLGVLANRGPEVRAREVLASEGPAVLRSAIADLLIGLDFRCGRHEQKSPIGLHRLRDGSFACGLGLAFGHTGADALRQLVDAAGAAGAKGFRPAPGRALLTIGLASETVAAFGAIAEELGFIVHADDPRRRIVACAGAPICASAHIAARAMAPGIAAAAAVVNGAITIHVSGCAKGCAHWALAVLTVVGTPDGCALVADGSARDAPFTAVPAEDLNAAIARFAQARMHESGHV